MLDACVCPIFLLVKLVYLREQIMDVASRIGIPTLSWLKRSTRYLVLFGLRISGTKSPRTKITHSVMGLLSVLTKQLV